MVYSEDGSSLVVATTNGVYVHNLDQPNSKPKYTPAVPPIILSPDGIYAADANRVFQVSDGVTILQLGEGVYPKLFSPNGEAILIRDQKSRSDSFEFWSLLDGEKILDVPLESEVLQFSPQGDKVATGLFWSQVDIFGIPSGELLNSIELPLSFEDFGKQTATIAFSSDSNHIAIGIAAGEYAGGAIKIYHLDDGSEDLTIGRIGRNLGLEKEACDESNAAYHWSHDHDTTLLSYSPDGRLLAAIYTTEQLILYNPSTGGKLQEIEGVNAFRFSPDSSRIMISYTNGQIREIVIVGSQVTYSVDGYNSKLESLEISSDGNLLAVQYNNSAILYKIDTGSIIFDAPNAKMALATDGESFALGFSDGKIEIRSTFDASLILRYQGHSGKIYDLLYIPTGELVSTADNCTTYMWETNSSTKKLEFEQVWYDGHSEHKTRINNLNLLLFNDGQELVGYAPHGNNSPNWNLIDGTLLSLKGRTNPDKILAQRSPSNGTVSISLEGLSYDTGITIFPGGSNLPIAKFTFPHGFLYNHTSLGISNAIFSPDGRILILGTYDGTILLWGVLP